MKKNQNLASISVAIATYNESQNISRCLDSVHNWVDEIVLVDGSPDNNTTKVAQKYSKVKIIKTNNKPMFHLNKNMAIKACTSDWILQLDADEVVSQDLKNKIKNILSQNISKIAQNGYWINRSNYFLGTFLKKGGQYPDPTIRLYKNGKGILPCKDVHEQAKIEGEIGHIQSDILHFADPSFSRYLLRSNRYTSLEANNLYTSGFKPSFSSWFNYFIIKPFSWFISSYFRHKGFIDGFPGYVFSLFSSLRFPIIYIKAWELSKNKRDINLNQDWD